MPTRISYDGMSRLTSAGYLENGKRNNHFSTSCKYDLMGNILSLRREGLLNSGNYGTIDDLAYTYDGNQVIKIDDSVEESPCYDGAMHFVDGADKDEEYTYDANGNMTSDLNKRVLHIDYNALNLPQQIAVEALRVGSGSTNNIKYTYAADGTKLRAEYTGKLLFTPIILPSMGGSSKGDYSSTVGGSVTSKNSFIGSGSNVGSDSEVGGGTHMKIDSIINVIPSTPYSRTTTIDYCANLIYENKKLSSILFDGGYASVDKDGNIVMHYYVKDHLGSNRLVVDGNGNIEETNHYYPFGALMGDSKNTRKNKYKYVGKELDTMYGWNMQDHGARWYDPVVGRWMVTDPLQEKYASVSSYCYTVNDPIRFIDTDGKIVRPNGPLAMSIILNTLPIDSRRYITLDKNGCLDLNLMNQYDGDSKNFNSLKTLVKSDYDIYITTLKSTKYVNDGRISIERFLPVEKVESFIDTDFTSCSGNITGETGNLGVTYMPANGGLGKSDADNPNSIHVNINPSLSPTGAAEAFSHEAYGHALIFVESGGNRNRAIHHFQGSHDANLELVNKSISARKETIKNMEDETLVNN